MAIRAAVFDMDGVIVDSEPYSVQALVEVLREHGIEPTAEDLGRSYGRTVREDFTHYFRKYGVTADLDAAISRKHARYYSLAEGHLKPFAGVVSLLERLRKRAYRLGLASSGDQKKVAFGMHALNLVGTFEAVVTGDDVRQSKPHPEIYLIAAQRLGIQPSECVAIEDAPAGVESAKRAGMRCIAVTNSVAREHLQGADLIVDSLEHDLSPLLPL
ncbi:MAG: HAD family phosphatase [Nitrospinae bacterium]|nr:HAD family phosphatase [Nitrospinota bacterium]